MLVGRRVGVGGGDGGIGSIYRGALVDVSLVLVVGIGLGVCYALIEAHGGGTHETGISAGEGSWGLGRWMGCLFDWQFRDDLLGIGERIWDGEQLEPGLAEGVESRVTRGKNGQTNSKVVTGSGGVP